MGYRKVIPEFRCENNIIPNSDELLMLGVTVDDMLKFDKHVAETLEKVNERAVRFVFRDKLHMKNFLSILIRTLLEQRLSKIL